MKKSRGKIIYSQVDLKSLRNLALWYTAAYISLDVMWRLCSNDFFFRMLSIGDDYRLSSKGGESELKEEGSGVITPLRPPTQAKHLGLNSWRLPLLHAFKKSLQNRPLTPSNAEIQTRGIQWTPARAFGGSLEMW